MAETPIDPVYLYILVRTDFASMVQGRSDAQVSHATSDFHELFFDRRLRAVLNPNMQGWEYTGAIYLFNEWKSQTAEKGSGRFGTTIVLGSNSMDDIYGVVAMAKKASYDAWVTHDPEYWRTDGSKAYALPEDTCGWIFGRKGELKPLLRQFPLLKPLDPADANR